MQKSITAANGQVITATTTDAVITTDGRTATIQQGSLFLSITPPPVVVEPPPVVIDPVPITGVPSTARLVFGSDFSTLSPFQNDNGVFYQLGKGGLVTDNGNSVFNSLVLAGAAPISSGYRSELTVANLPISGEMYFTFTAKMMKDPGTDQGHFFQIHPENSTGSAAFGIYFNAKQFSIIRSISAGVNIYETARKAYNIGQWYSFRIHAKWSSGTDGLIEVFIDNVLFQTSRGANLPSEGGYLKFGINMWSSSAGSPRYGMNVRYDDLKIYRV